MRLLEPCPRCEAPPFDRECPKCLGYGHVGLTRVGVALWVGAVAVIAILCAVGGVLVGAASR